MSIAHRIAKVRAHLPDSVWLRGYRGRLGDTLIASNDKGAINLFVTAGVPFSPKQAAANFVTMLGGGA